MENIHELYAQMSEREKEVFMMGRVSVLDDFDAMCCADAFMGFSDDEWSSIKKFFAFNNALRGKDN